MNIPIKNNATGYSYFSLFKRCLSPDVTCVKLYEVDDHKIENIVAFCEMIIKNCKPKIIEINNITKEVSLLYRCSHNYFTA